MNYLQWPSFYSLHLRNRKGRAYWPMKAAKSLVQEIFRVVQESWNLEAFSRIPRSALTQNKENTEVFLEQDFVPRNRTKVCWIQGTRSANLPVEVFLSELVTHEACWRTLSSQRWLVKGKIIAAFRLQKLLEFWSNGNSSRWFWCEDAP